MNAPDVPAPLTAYGWHCQTQQRARGAKAFQAYVAGELANALADEAPADEVEDKLAAFKWARNEFAKCKAVAELAEAEYVAEIDASMADRKKMPPAVAAAEGVETPND
ncbi:hypothetical protein ACSYDW_01205 [Paeniglutamicibacter sp. R2-26]|uniref:hypothetical protein n=1 Tax=Paeniglutamicibacter sp. R2-26 TaxID=3144417 RepID=UPI003EE42D43